MWSIRSRQRERHGHTHTHRGVVEFVVWSNIAECIRPNKVTTSWLSWTTTKNLNSGSLHGPKIIQYIIFRNQIKTTYFINQSSYFSLANQNDLQNQERERESLVHIHIYIGTVRENTLHLFQQNQIQKKRLLFKGETTCKTTPVCTNRGHVQSLVQSRLQGRSPLVLLSSLTLVLALKVLALVHLGLMVPCPWSNSLEEEDHKDWYSLQKMI